MTVSNTDRRSFIGAGALVAGAGLAATSAAAQTAGGEIWKPTPEKIDAWMDKPGTRHRMVYDTTSPDAFGYALFFASNFYAANQSGYGLGPEALGVIVIARHHSTPFGYSDAAWAKYGAGLAEIVQLKGDDAKLAKTRNPMFAAKHGDRGANVSEMGAKGVRFAVCGLATRVFASILAKDAGMSADAIEDYLKANLVPGAVIVPAGIVAINRAQEHGYAFAYVA